MKATSRVMVWAILIMLVSMVLVLGLVLVLLAELYCSLLLRRRRRLQLPSPPVSALTTTTDNFTPRPPQPLQDSSASPLTSIYSHGVLRAPRSFLFPLVSGEGEDDLEKQNPHQSQPPISSASQRVGVALFASVLSSPSPEEFQKIQLQESTSFITSNQSVSSSGKEQFMYISNPIYDNETSRVDTPFETPKSSPSRLESNASSEEDDVHYPSSTTTLSPSTSPVTTPPLTPMKKLPAEACSVSLRDSRSLGISGSESNSNNDGLSSSSSGSPCTSPSW